jgi:hypothetical protein
LGALIQSVAVRISVTALTGWLDSFLALRKDERFIQIEQVTKERTKWRGKMRELTEEIILIYIARSEKKTLTRWRPVDADLQLP